MCQAMCVCHKKTSTFAMEAQKMSTGNYNAEPFFTWLLLIVHIYQFILEFNIDIMYKKKGLHYQMIFRWAPLLYVLLSVCVCVCLSVVKLIFLLEYIILPTPGEAKAKAMPGRLYIHTK